jgi:hypothetical protein
MRVAAVDLLRQAERAVLDRAQASRNAYKGGTRAMLRELARLLREQGEALKRIG